MSDDYMLGVILEQYVNLYRTHFLMLGKCIVNNRQEVMGAALSQLAKGWIAGRPSAAKTAILGSRLRHGWPRRSRSCRPTTWSQVHDTWLEWLDTVSVRSRAEDALIQDDKEKQVPPPSPLVAAKRSE
jgi:hypothetical protein